MLFSKASINNTVNLLFCALLILVPVASQAAEPDLKATLRYDLYPDRELKLRLTRIPTEFGMIERNWNGEIAIPKIGSEILSQSIEDLEIRSTDGKLHVLPSGTKFYARVISIQPAASFQKDGSVQMEFYKFEIPGDIVRKTVYLKEPLKSNSQEASSKLSKSFKVAASTLGGIIAAPVLTALGLGISGNIIGLSSGATPFIYGASAAIGGGIGLVYGLSRKGSMLSIEPGLEIILKPSQTWQLALSEELPTLEQVTMSRQSQSLNELEPVELQIHKVKKTQDIYGSPCLNIVFTYKNHSKEKLRYSSFVLVDSMANEYEASPSSISEDSIGEVAETATLSMNFPVEFIKTVHYLQVRTMFNQKTLASARVLLP